ncbi:septum formation initiator [Streptomyces sp. BPTC-684]|uniref:septum formation initiator n=1 Tax=Streptomyces sp. BPTC-684 TaxID=3043734 RepID=UPI0024B0F981|nr:septum formation initiator [Streptomyces sp. BPTC-684]WHM39116.1 septum formation initiator [Streptomyces sp. BPTC-684]
MSRPARQLRGRAARLGRLLPPAGARSAARTPFVLLVVVLLGGGLISLLLLNSALNEGSFKLSELRRQTTELTDEQQALQHDVDGLSAPDALSRRATELGMVPGGSPLFLNPNGTVKGVPGAGAAQPAPALSPEMVQGAAVTAPASAPATEPPAPNAQPTPAPAHTPSGTPPRAPAPAAPPAPAPAKTSPTPGR